MRSLNFRTLALKSARVARDKKADDIRVLNVKPLTTIANYFVLCSGNSDVQVRTVAEAIEGELKKSKYLILHREADSNHHWIILDYGGVIVNIFSKPIREFYDLDGFWADAREIKW